MFNWLFGSTDSTPDQTPYKVEDRGDVLKITDRDTGEVHTIHANNDGRNWRILENRYYRDSNGELKKTISYDNNDFED